MLRSMVVGVQLEASGSRGAADIHAGLSAFFPAEVTSPVFSHPENHSAPPDVTSYANNTSSSTTSERAPSTGTAAQKQTPKYGNAELMETGDGEPRLAVPQAGRPPWLVDSKDTRLLTSSGRSSR